MHIIKLTTAVAIKKKKNTVNFAYLQVWIYSPVALLEIGTDFLATLVKSTAFA